MADKNFVTVKSTVKAQVGINIPELRLKREWAKKGAVQKIEFDDLEQAIYDPGVEYMFKSGILYIDDLDTKIALGLEPEGAKKPENIIVLSEIDKKRYLTVAPIHEFKDILKKMSHDQIIELAKDAIELKITDMARADLLKVATNIDVAQQILTNHQTEMAEKAGTVTE